MRLERAEVSRLAWAFALSIAFHLLLFGGYYGGKKLAAWEKIPRWLRPVKELVQALQKRPVPAAQPRLQQAPLMFVEVNPAQAMAEPPKEAKYYSDKNSQAANPQKDKNSDVPKIAGIQTQIVKTEDVPRSEYKPLQPTPPAPVTKPAEEEQPELKPKPTPPPGDLAMAKPDPNPPKDPGDAPRPRPRTLKEARARLPENLLAGQKMKQDGGVDREARTESLDVKATGYGAYDYIFIKTVEQRWFKLLDERDYAADSRGKVMLQFTLHYDGRITDLSVGENTAGEVLGLICEKAVLDPAPFPRWPSDMRHEMGDSRKIQFTFFYQ